MEARIARLEASVGHIRKDVRDIKMALAQLVPVVNRMDGFLQATLPTLATRADVEREAASLARFWEGSRGSHRGRRQFRHIRRL